MRVLSSDPRSAFSDRSASSNIAARRHTAHAGSSRESQAERSKWRSTVARSRNTTSVAGATDTSGWPAVARGAAGGARRGRAGLATAAALPALAAPRLAAGWVAEV